MKSINITGTKRPAISKQNLKMLRSQGQVPCVLYGGNENIHFASSAMDFKKLVYTPEVQTVNLQIDGTNYNAIMKEVQFHPIHDHIMHIDFQEIHPENEVEISVPVKLKGSSVGVKEGGRLIQKLRKLRISALHEKLPDHIEIDITPLKIGDSVRVANLKKEGVTFLDSENNIVVGVRVTREVVEEAPAATAAAPAAGSAPAATPAAAAPGAAPAAAPAKAAEKK